MDHDEVESIPWGELMDEAAPPQDVRRIATLVAALLVAAVVGAVVARSMWTPSGTTVIAPAGSIAASPAPEATDPGQAVTTTTALPLYSEADLMADPPDPGERSAIVRAEWFVTDYFTADYEPTGSADVRAALPVAADFPDLPQDGAGGISYVEWARAFDVHPTADGEYRVSVAFRVLAAPPDGAFTRLPVRAVDVMVQVGPGGASVVDLPRPASLPVGPEPAPWPQGEAAPPGEVVDFAATQASAWGSEPRIVSAVPTESGWRVVMTVADDVGNRWPLSLVVPA